MNRIYTPTQLLHALGRVKGGEVPNQASRVDIGSAQDGSCVVNLIMDATRDPLLDVVTTFSLSAEETRAWRAELQVAFAAELPPNPET